MKITLNMSRAAAPGRSISPSCPLLGVGAVSVRPQRPRQHWQGNCTSSLISPAIAFLKREFLRVVVDVETQVLSGCRLGAVPDGWRFSVNESNKDLPGGLWI